MQVKAETLESVRVGRMNPLQGPWSIPQLPIDIIFHTATQQSPSKRFKDANGLADAIGAWLTGEQNEQRAKSLLDRALAQNRFGCSLQADGNDHSRGSTANFDSIPRLGK